MYWKLNFLRKFNFLKNFLKSLFENIAKFEYLVMPSDGEASLSTVKLRFLAKLGMTFRTASRCVAIRLILF